MRNGFASPYWLVALVAGYYLCAWLLVGRNRASRSVVVRYAPPDGISPAAMRYIAVMQSDGRSYAAIIAQLAAKKLLAIVMDPDIGAVTLQKLSKEGRERRNLPEEEARVFKDLFEWDDRVPWKRPELSTIRSIESILEAQASARYLTRNFVWVAVGLILTAAVTAWLAWSSGIFGHDPVDAGVDSSFAGLTVAVYGLAGYWMWDQNRLAFTLALRGLYLRRTLPLLLVFIFLYPALWYVLIRTVAPQFAVVTMFLILLNGLAGPSLRNYTAAGRRMRDEIEGFRQFLASSEQDRLQRVNALGEPAPIDPEMIPYAIALDLREGWGDQLGIKAMVETVL
jgi:hypothetical protein